MPNQPSEGKYTFVLFHTGTTEGRAIMPDREYEPETLDIRLKHQYGPQTQMIAVLNNLTDLGVGTLGQIFDHVNDMRVRTSDDLREVLRLRPRFFEIREARAALRDALPEYLSADTPEGEECAAYMSQLIDLYVKLGDDPDAFEREAEILLQDVPLPIYSGCLSFFQTLLHETLPKIRKEAAERN